MSDTTKEKLKVVAAGEGEKNDKNEKKGKKKLRPKRDPAITGMYTAKNKLRHLKQAEVHAQKKKVKLERYMGKLMELAAKKLGRPWAVKPNRPIRKEIRALRRFLSGKNIVRGHGLENSLKKEV